MKARFTIEYHTKWGENLFLVCRGRKYPMEYCQGGFWTVEIDKFTGAMLLDYSYEVVCDGIVMRQEWRHHSRKAARGETSFRDAWNDVPAGGNGFLHEHSMAQFDKKGFRGAGTAIPVFSLRSEHDFGVGEFYDLMPMADWASQTGQTVLQLLPINDTTMTHEWMDSYPYNANSTFALHPQFINLPAAGVKVTAAYKKMRAELNALPKIDYVKVNAAKTKLLKEVFAGPEGKKVLESENYRDFFDANAHWLLPYAVFCALRDENGTPDFTQWGPYAKYSLKKAKDYYSAHKDEVDYHCFVQYHLDKQLKEVRVYAHARGVAFKGDLPIGISRTSVDAWCHPDLFNMDSQCGAPPDAFAVDGQNWGFPTYNWDKMAEDHYAWWKSRLGKMAEYFDAFRIDHILGFFRIWEIPVPEKSGLMGHFSPAMPYAEDEIRAKGLPLEGIFLEDPHHKGYWHPRISAQFTEAYSRLNEWQKWSYNELYDDFFYHRHNEFWKRQAMRKLPELLGATGMLACGEDLGMIPACVPEVMGWQKILSLEIQRMPKDPKQTFAIPSEYPYMSVCTTSTHDMSPLRAWWEEEDREHIQRYYNEVLGRGGKAPAECTPEICEQIIAQHLASPAMFTILPLQDWLGMSAELRFADPAEERINVPAICPYYWRYRMHLTLENLLSQKEFNDKVKGMVEESGR
ncbi:MAG: 4-alpha-glucanotransferase [Bacteroidales bacterium]|nr:4-alpha-glucanotransferase [Bacteroidales bacterium]